VSAPKVKQAPKGFTGEWNHARFLRACRAHGIEVGHRGDAPALRQLIATAPNGRGRIIDHTTAARLLAGDRDPSRGRAGEQPLAIEIALALDVSLDWLLSKDKR
jgi:hypothetical protein